MGEQNYGEPGVYQRPWINKLPFRIANIKVASFAKRILKFRVPSPTLPIRIAPPLTLPGSLNDGHRLDGGAAPAGEDGSGVLQCSGVECHAEDAGLYLATSCITADLGCITELIAHGLGHEVQQFLIGRLVSDRGRLPAMRHSRSIWLNGWVAPALQNGSGDFRNIAGGGTVLKCVEVLPELVQLLIRRPLRLGLGQGGAGAEDQFGICAIVK